MIQGDQLKTSLELIKLMTKSLEESFRQIKEQDLKTIGSLVFFFSRSTPEELDEFLAIRSQGSQGAIRDNPFEVLKRVQEVYFPLFEKKEVTFKEFILREDVVLSFNKEQLTLFLVLYLRELLAVAAPSSQIILQPQIDDGAYGVAYLLKRDRTIQSFSHSTQLQAFAEKLNGEVRVEELENQFFRSVLSFSV